MTASNKRRRASRDGEQDDRGRSSNRSRPADNALASLSRVTHNTPAVGSLAQLCRVLDVRDVMNLAKPVPGECSSTTWRLISAMLTHKKLRVEQSYAITRASTASLLKAVPWDVKALSPTLAPLVDWWNRLGFDTVDFYEAHTRSYRYHERLPADVRHLAFEHAIIAVPQSYKSEPFQVKLSKSTCYLIVRRDRFSNSDKCDALASLFSINALRTDGCPAWVLLTDMRSSFLYQMTGDASYTRWKLSNMEHAIETLRRLLCQTDESCVASVIERYLIGYRVISEDVFEPRRRSADHDQDPVVPLNNRAVLRHRRQIIKEAYGWPSWITRIFVRMLY